MRLLKYAGIYFIVSIVFAVFSLIALYPWHPTTVLGFFALAAVALPIWILIQLIGEKLFSDKISKKIDSRDNKVSGSRMLYALVISIIFIAIIVLAGDMINSGFSEFLNNNFSKKW